MSTSSRGKASDSPSQAVTRKICQAEDALAADKLREEQSAVNQDLSNRLEEVEKTANRESETNQAVEALAARLTALEDLGPRLDSHVKVAEDVATRIGQLEQSTEGALARIEKLLEESTRAPAKGEDLVPFRDPLVDDTVKELRAQVNGLLERESELTRGTQVKEEGQDSASPARQVDAKPAKAVSQVATAKSVRIKEEANTSDEDVLDALQGFESTDVESADQKETLSFWERDIGPKFQSMNSIKPADPRFDRLMSYRFYRLSNRAQTRNSQKTQQLRSLIRQMNTTLGDEKFDGTDPVMVFDFLIRVFEESDNLGMSEAQALAVMPYYLSGEAKKLYATARRGKNGNGISSWCGAVQWLLRTYANSAAIRTAVQDFRGTKQRQDETEVPYGNRVRIAAYRCGNVFTDAELMNVFTDGLSPATRTLVARFRESSGRSLTFEQLVSFARDEGDAYRARQPARVRPKGVLPGPSRVNFVESDTVRSSEQDQDVVGLLPDWSATPDHSELPSTVDDAGDAILYGERMVRPQHLPYSGPSVNRSRPGWQTSGGYPQASRIICYVCYAVGHVASQCGCPLRDVERVKRNFEALTREEKEKVPRQAYERTIAYLQAVPPRNMFQGQQGTGGPSLANANQQAVHTGAVAHAITKSDETPTPESKN